VPPVCRDDDGRVSHRIKVTTDLLLRCEKHLLFDLLPLAILSVEKIGQRRRLGFVLG
jgi:hypothetical protein